MEPEKYFQVIKEAGYGVRKDSMRFTMTGKLIIEGEKRFFVMEDVGKEPVKFLLIKGESKDKKETEIFVEGWKQLESLTEISEIKVEIEGNWLSTENKDKKKPKDTNEKNPPATLSVRSIKKNEK